MKVNEGLRVLVVDDEKSIRRFLKVELSAKGYRVFEAEDGRSAIEASASVRPDAVILDLGLPDMEGVEVMREMRSRASMPVIVVSVREQEKDKIEALDAGADDYLTKPFSSEELFARLRAVIRRWIPKDKDQIFKTGQIVADLTRRKVTVKDIAVHLTPTEYDVFKILIFNAGKVVTQQQLFREVWNKPDGTGGLDHLLRVTVSKLRAKIEPDEDRPVYITTEPGVGYRLRYDQPAADADTAFIDK